MKTISAVKTVFSGEVTGFSRNGNSVKAKGRFGPGAFESQLPVFVKGTICNHLHGSYGDGSHLISQGCTGPDAVMKKSNWKFTATVTGVPSSVFPYSLHLTALTGVGTAAAAALAGSAVFLNWFANGWIEWGTGNAIQRRALIGSTVPVATALVVTLHRYFSAIPGNGDSVVIYPGCDGQFSTCKAYNSGSNPTGKFGNQLNYGSDPFMPTSNPSSTGLPSLATQGGKK